MNGSYLFKKKNQKKYGGPWKNGNVLHCCKERRTIWNSPDCLLINFSLYVIQRYFEKGYFSLYSARNDQGRLELSNVVFIFYFCKFYLCMYFMYECSFYMYACKLEKGTKPHYRWL